MRSSRLVRDVRPRVTHTHHEDRARLELGRVPILARVELSDRWIEVVGERRDARLSECTGRHDHPLRLPTQRARRHEIPAARPGHGLDTIDAGAADHREIEPSRVRLRGSRPSRDPKDGGTATRGNACRADRPSRPDCTAGANPNVPASGPRSARRHRSRRTGCPAASGGRRPIDRPGPRR